MNNNLFFNPSQGMIRSVPFTSVASVPRSSGLLGGLFGGTRAATGAASKVTFSGILNGASKTLGVINQAIPVFYQVKPMWNNAKTMFRVAKELNSNNANTNLSNNSFSNNINKNTDYIDTNKKESSNSPTFFL